MRLRNVFAAVAVACVFALGAVGRADAQPSLVASPTTINHCGVFGVTWNNAPANNWDWIGVYEHDAPDTNPVWWVWAMATSYTWVINPGCTPNVNKSYEFRMFCCNGFMRLGSSNYVWVQDPNTPQSPTPQDPGPIQGPNTANPAPTNTAPAGQTLLYDYTDAVWYTGPVINGQTYSTNAAGAFQGAVNFPSNGEIDYVTTPSSGPLPSGGTIVFTLDVSNGPLIGTEEPTGAGQIFVYFQKRGDNWAGDTGHRWWSNASAHVASQVGGRWTISVPLTYSNWCSVLTCRNQTEFLLALGDVENIGWTGGSNSKGHGLRDADGAAWLRVVEYKVYRP